MDDKDIVSALCVCLAEKVGQERFELWLGGQARFTVRGESLLVELPNRFVQGWVRSHFRREIESACCETFGKSLATEFSVDAALGRSGPAPQRMRETADGAERQLEFDCAVAVAEPPQHGSSSVARNRPPIAQSELNTPCAIAGTVRPELKRRPYATLDSYVVGHSNRLAYASAQVAADEPGKYSPLLIHGPTGVGKTHLLEGILTSARKRKPGLHAIHLSAEQFTTLYVEALHGGGLPSFRRKYRGIELLLIDDLQFFVGKKATLGELLHTIDTLVREGRQLVFSSDRSPVMLREVLGEELPTRLSSGMPCGIERPDFQTRLGVLRQISLLRMQFDLVDDVAVPSTSPRI